MHDTYAAAEPGTELVVGLCSLFVLLWVPRTTRSLVAFCLVVALLTIRSRTLFSSKDSNHRHSRRFSVVIQCRVITYYCVPFVTHETHSVVVHGSSSSMLQQSVPGTTFRNFHGTVRHTATWFLTLYLQHIDTARKDGFHTTGTWYQVLIVVIIPL